MQVHEFYDKLLFHVPYVVIKKLVDKDIRKLIVEFATEVVSTDRMITIERYMADFETISLWEMFSDVDDLSFVIDRIR